VKPGEVEVKKALELAELLEKRCAGLGGPLWETLGDTAAELVDELRSLRTVLAEKRARTRE